MGHQYLNAGAVNQVPDGSEVGGVGSHDGHSKEPPAAEQEPGRASLGLRNARVSFNLSTRAHGSIV